MTGMTDERPLDGLRNGLTRTTDERSGDISYLQGKDERERNISSFVTPLNNNSESRDRTRWRNHGRERALAKCRGDDERNVEEAASPSLTHSIAYRQ